MYRPKNIQERILHRYKIVQGHLNKVMQMVEQQEYCIDILHQTEAIQRSLRAIDNLLMENHLKTCATEAIEKGESQRAVEEVMSVFKKTRR